MPISMTPYRVFDSYRSITPAFFMRHGIRLRRCDLTIPWHPSPSRSRTRTCAAGSPMCGRRVWRS